MEVVDVRRLRLLLELSRLGSMREVADELGLTTSTVSQQIAALAREAGTPLLEPDRPPGPADPGRPAPRRPRGHDPGRGRRGPARPRPGRRAGRDGPGRRLRDRDGPLAAAGGPRPRVPPIPTSGWCCTSTSRWRPSTCWPATTWTWPSSTTTTWPRSRRTDRRRGRPALDARRGAWGCRPTEDGDRRGPADLAAYADRAVDRELPPHRRRGRPAHPGLPGRVHPPGHPPHRQPRPGGRAGRARASASPCCRWTGPSRGVHGGAAGRHRDPPAGVRRGAARTRRLAAATAAAGPARRPDGRSSPTERSSSPPPTRSATAREPGPGDVGDRGQPGPVRVGPGPGRLGGVDAQAVPGAAVLGVLQGDRVPRRTAAGEEVEHPGVVGHGGQDPPHQPGRLRRLEDVADEVLELGDRGVGGADLRGQPDRAQLLAPAPLVVAVQPVLLEHVDPLAAGPADHPADQVAGLGLDLRPAPPPHRRGAVAEHRRDLHRAVVRRRAHPAALRVAPDREVQGAGGDRVELLVGVAQRQVPEAAPVRRRSAGSRARRRCRRCWRRARSGAASRA